MCLGQRQPSSVEILIEAVPAVIICLISEAKFDRQPSALDDKNGRQVHLVSFGTGCFRLQDLGLRVHVPTLGAVGIDTGQLR